MGTLESRSFSFMCCLEAPHCQAFLNPLFGGPVVCTPDSRGFRYSVVSVSLIFTNPALNSQCL